MSQRGRQTPGGKKDHDPRHWFDALSGEHADRIFRFLNAWKNISAVRSSASGRQGPLPRELRDIRTKEALGRANDALIRFGLIDHAEIVAEAPDRTSRLSSMALGLPVAARHAAGARR